MADQVSRDVEILKYMAAYQRPRYRMGNERRENSTKAIDEWAFGRGYRTFLDVGAGRGEILDFVQDTGSFQQIYGTEVVSELIQSDGRLRYAEAHALDMPDRSVDVVTCFDVLEHLLPDDVNPAVDQLFRIARAVVIISAAEDSQFQEGIEHHPSRRPLNKWRALLHARARPFHFRFVASRPCRKGSEIWIFTGKKSKVDTR
jgi:2-polyprenyl-3-methyl-5-hydroxy-6-metoxy-1,4-benzoquinol methylase